MASLPPGRLMAGEFSRFLRDIASVSRHRAALALFYQILGSSTEGLSILLLIPILGMMADTGSAGVIRLPEGWFPEWLVPGGEIGLAALLAGFVVLVIIQAFFNRYRSIYMSQLVFAYANRLRIDLFQSIGNANWATFTRQRTSEISHALTGNIERIQGAAFSTFLMIQAAIMLVAYVTVSLLISPGMTAVAFVVGGIMLALMQPIRSRAMSHGHTLTENQKAQYQTIGEFLGGYKFAKSINMEGKYFDRFSETVTNMVDDYIRFTKASTISNVLFQISGAIVVSVVIYISLTVFEMTIAHIVVMIIVFMRISPRFMEFQSHLQQVIMNLPSFASMRQLRARFDAAREPDYPASPEGFELRLEDRIEARDISVVYDREQEKAAVCDVSFVIPANRVTALIGASGSGKSTTADVLLGLIHPIRGEIRVDGVRLDHSNRRKWRESVAYVPQDVSMLNDTIAVNLRLGAPDATDRALWAALQAAQCLDFVQRLDGGLETVIGERGVMLSGGERQRIALARALLRKPKLLILDEATSSLDWENQALVAKSIEQLRGSMTILTIAHRPSMIQFADWVIAMEGGKVVEAGAYDSLCTKPGSRLSQMLAGEREESLSPTLYGDGPARYRNMWEARHRARSFAIEPDGPFGRT